MFLLHLFNIFFLQFQYEILGCAFFFFIILFLFIYFWLCWVFVAVQAFSSCDGGGYSVVVVRRLLIAVVCLIGERRL